MNREAESGQSDAPDTFSDVLLKDQEFCHENWQQDAGPTVFAPFGMNTTYFGDPEQSWMVNFRVADLEAMAAQLRAAGITDSEIESHPNGNFARIHNPEGNPIELWEPREPK